ncbi:MAG: transketolase [Candidatus Dormibacteria bacterium]
MAQTPSATLLDEHDLSSVAHFATQLRVDSIRVSTHAGSGHPTSSLSAADLMAVLFARHLHYDFSQPKHPDNDHLIFSKGHASPLLYSIYRGVGAVTEEEFLTYRALGSRLEGHPTPILPWVDVATGSLGQGLPIAVGVALALKEIEHRNAHVWVLCGDSELTEGSVWEAFDKAALHNLDNLTVMVDINRLGQRGETELGWDIESYARRMESFGLYTLAIDGHNLGEIDEAFTEVSAVQGRPSVILAKTIKGKGVPEIENKNGWHGKTLPKEMADTAIKELGGVTNHVLTPHAPTAGAPALSAPPFAGHSLPTYQVGSAVPTRKAFGDALAALGDNPSLVVIDAEVGNSTHTDEFGTAFPDRFFQTYIAEQQMVATGVGMQVRGFKPVMSTFGAFFSRAYDFIRMAAVSQANLYLVGSHAGTEIGQDGPSQMALEDIASLRAVHGSTVLYPSDATSTVALVREMLDRPGIVYMRTTRGSYPVLYDATETFPIGGAKVLRTTSKDVLTIVAAGVTVHSALAAHDELAAQGISVRVIDLYSVKPIDKDTIQAAVDATGRKVLVVEDHYPEGGIGEAVLSSLDLSHGPYDVRHLAVDDLPGSGTPKELMDQAGIGITAIVSAAKDLAGKA